MTKDLAIRILGGAILGTTEQTHEAVAMAIKALSALPSASDLIDRRAAIDALDEQIEQCDKSLSELDISMKDWYAVKVERASLVALRETLKYLPSAQPEPLTDKEQRIFLAAMGREERVCKEVDRHYVREPYEDSLVRVCKEIRRKVKGALWET